MQAVKVLHELAGDFAKSLRVYDPRDRTDSRTGRRSSTPHRRTSARSSACRSRTRRRRRRRLAFLLPNQWSMIDQLHMIPDTVDEFTGFSIDFDLVAWTFPARMPPNSAANGTAHSAQRRCCRPTTTTSSCPWSQPLAHEPRCATGSTPTFRAGRTTRRRCLPTRRGTCCGRPTSGTASRSTGASKRSGWCVRIGRAIGRPVGPRKAPRGDIRPGQVKWRPFAPPQVVAASGRAARWPAAGGCAAHGAIPRPYSRTRSLHR